MNKSYKINYSWRPTYFQVLQLTQAFFTNPETPNMAAILCLLSRGNNLLDFQKELRKWLYNYISPFALNSVRDEQNLEEKTLAIAAYFLLEGNNKGDEWKLPDEQLINYVEYAERQSWFDDPFLAFFCHQLRDRLTCCEKIDTYFQSKYEMFLQKKHIPSISQALIVLQNSASSVDIQRGYEAINLMLKSADLSSKHIAWALWAYSEQPRHYEQNITNLNSLLEKEIVKLLRDIQWESGLSSTLAFALISKGDSSPDDYLDKINLTFGKDINVRQDGTGYSLNIKPKTPSEGFNLSISDLGLILMALYKSKFNKIAYVNGLQEEELPVLENSLDALIHGSIILNRTEKMIVNFLVILFTLLTMVLVLYLQMGLPNKLSSIEFKGDYLATLGVWLDLFIAQLKSVLSGENALGSLRKTLIYRLFSLFKKARN
jgi:hypothetical protein